MNSDFENRHLSKVQQIALWVLTAHIPVCAAVAIYFGLAWLPVVLIGAAILSGPVLACHFAPGTRTASMAIGIASQCFVALLIHSGCGMIELHFHVFVTIAALVVLCDWLVVVVAALTIAVHHVAFFFLLPASVFNYHAGFGVVLLHATFVTMETIPTAAIAWKFGRFARAQGVLGDSFAKLSDRVMLAANEISISSQTLTDGAGAQAASIEETSSSLEAMAVMTKSNAANAQKANDLARQTREAADQSVADMQAMAAAMTAIKASSDDVAKIIKTIDGIAFQTNILALNAAVEAARAGESGLGFAVVADEVRNLAQRSAQAARETSLKIQGALSNTTQGVNLSGKVGETLNVIVTKARQVVELATEVASASREQTQGFSQVNLAVGQMEKITRSNAASAQESAAASHELKSLAQGMRHTLAELLNLVGGARAVESAQKSSPSAPPASKKSFPVLAPSAKGRSPQPTSLPARPSPSKIPLEHDFQDF
jgi:methyl-accepting chemotaxis protein